MSDDADRYRDIASGTLDEVKEAVETQDLDIEKVLDAEKDGKDRVTLVEWLEEQIEGAVPEEVDVMAQESEARYVSMELLPVQERTVTFFGGIVLGIILVTALVMAGVFGPVTQDVSEADLQEAVQSYLSDNRAAFQLPSGSTVSVDTVEAVDGTGLYEATATFEASIENQTLSQDVPVYVTGDGGYILIGNLFDMSRPVAEQTTTQ